MSSRHSAKFGPFRLNLSKSGFSYSFGIKGARIKTGPRGTFVTFSSQGITYRRRIDQVAEKPTFHPQQTIPLSDTEEHTITSAAINQLTDAESKDFINELTEKSKKLSYVRWIGIPSSILYFIFLLVHFQEPSRTTYNTNYFVKTNTNSVKLHPTPSAKSKIIALLDDQASAAFLDSASPWWYKVRYGDTIGYISRQFAVADSSVKVDQIYTELDDHPTLFWILFFGGAAAGVLLCIYLHMVDKKRLQIDIHYEIDNNISQVYDKFIQHFSEIMASQKAWQYLNAKGTTDLKRNAGAQQLITRIGIASITPDKKPARFFTTNIQIPNIRLRNSDLYFFPERLVIKRGSEFAAVFYKHVQVDSVLTRFIEEEPVASDAEIVDWTWRYLNKNGTPDKRFNNNRRLPICHYSQYHFSSATGINEVLTTSRKGAFDNFSRFLTAIGQLQSRMAL